MFLLLEEEPEQTLESYERGQEGDAVMGRERIGKSTQKNEKHLKSTE